MAKKFLQISGFNKAFSELSSTALNLTAAGIKSSVQSEFNENTIAFITATDADAAYGFSTGDSYIWTRGKLYGSLNRELKVNGTSISDRTSSRPLDISTLSNYVKINYNNGVLSVDVSTATLLDASNGKEGLALSKDVFEVIKENEHAIANSFGLMQTNVGLNPNLSISWNNVFNASTSIVQAVKDLSTYMSSLKIRPVAATPYVSQTFDNGLLTTNVSTATLADASNGKDGLAIAADVYNTIIDNEKTTALLYGALDNKVDNTSIGLNSSIIEIENKLNNLSQDKIAKYGTATHKDKQGYELGSGTWNVSTRMQAKTHGFIIETKASDGVESRRNYVRSSLSDLYVHSDNQLHLTANKTINVHSKSGGNVNIISDHGEINTESSDTTTMRAHKFNFKCDESFKFESDTTTLLIGSYKLDAEANNINLSAWSSFNVHTDNYINFNGGQFEVVTDRVKMDPDEYRQHTTNINEQVNNGDITRIVNNGDGVQTKMTLGRHRAVIGVQYTDGNFAEPGIDTEHPSNWIDTGIIINKDAGIRFFKDGEEIEVGGNVHLMPIDDASADNDGAASAFELLEILKTISAALSNLNTRLEALENNTNV